MFKNSYGDVRLLQELEGDCVQVVAWAGFALDVVVTFGAAVHMANCLEDW